MAVLMFPSGYVDTPVVDAPRSSASYGRHAGLHQISLVGRLVAFFDNIGVTGSENEGAAQPVANDVDLVVHKAAGCVIAQRQARRSARNFFRLFQRKLDRLDPVPW